MANSPDYVWEKMMQAIGALCGEKPLEHRLASAGLALHTLRNDDLVGECEQDLIYVLDWTARNFHDARVDRMPNEIEYRRLVDKMIGLLLETDRICHAQR